MKLTVGDLVVLGVVCTILGSANGTFDSWTAGGTTVSSSTASFTVAVDEASTNIVTATVAITGSGATFSIVAESPTGLVEIASASSGAVTMISGQTLDRETNSQITFEIKCETTSDGSGTATVTITVGDINDETPAFTVPSADPHIIVAEEGATAGASVYTVTATDDDATATNNVITYTISNGNTNSDFSMAASTGVVTVATGKTLAKATTATYALEVTATDSGTSPAALSSTTTVSVIVWDCASSGIGNVSFNLALLLICLGLSYKFL